MGSSLAARRAKAGASSHTPMTATGSLSKMNERPRDVLLKDITLDLGLQFRLDVKGTGGIDEKHVLDLMHVIADGADTEPVIVYRVDALILMVDGFHRHEAYRRSGRSTIPAIVRDGTYQDAEEAAENANLQFKKALGDESKKYIFARRVQRGYQTNGISWRKLSDKAIAAELGVSDKTISRWFNELYLEGVTFVTPSNQEILIKVECDRSVVYGRDGNPINVEAIREANQQRAAELAERRAAEETERKRNLPAVEKIRIVTQYLIAKYRDDYAKKKNPLMDDPKCGFEWCYQVSNPASFVVDIDWERQFLHEYGAKPIHVYREFLRLADREVFTRADMDGWTDIQLEDWVREMGRRPPRQPNVSTFQQTGMAQPKHPDAEYQLPAATGRHRLTEVTTPESEASESTAPTVDDEPEVDTNPAPCPFKRDDRVVYKPSGKHCQVLSIKWDGQFWWLQVMDESQHDFKEYAAQFAVAPTTPKNQTIHPFRMGDMVRDLQTGQLVEVVGFASDGSITVEGDDELDQPYQYDGSVTHFEKYDTRATPPQAKPSGEYKPNGDTQVRMVENYMGLLRLVQNVNAALMELEEYDCNLQYLQERDTLQGLWDSVAAMNANANVVADKLYQRLTYMVSTGLPYDPVVADEVVKKGMQRL
ncbi:MAG: hypothetical protein BroJett018_32510 [Chloroflexota bacterium]|nr:hypothetical protein [Chloroflexota bacterium]NOG62348.1 ParB N-terminal domain-containing protein [Chloroflexota bacterium]GIK65457.1 MAG: hypothetical protein BroJett018_32510 [Chloroflexota bacterium]